MKEIVTIKPIVAKYISDLECYKILNRNIGAYGTYMLLSI